MKDLRKAYEKSKHLQGIVIITFISLPIGYAIAGMKGVIFGGIFGGLIYILENWTWVTTPP